MKKVKENWVETFFSFLEKEEGKEEAGAMNSSDFEVCRELLPKKEIEDYLTMGKQLEDLARREYGERKERTISDIAKILMKGKVVTWSYGTSLDDAGVLIGKKHFRPYLEEVKKAVNGKERRCRINEMLSSFSDKIKGFIQIDPVMDVKDSEPVARRLLDNARSISKDPAGVLLRLQVGGLLCYGYTGSHKKRWRFYMGGHFKDAKKEVFHVMDPEVFLGMLSVLDLIDRYFMERREELLGKGVGDHLHLFLEYPEHNQIELEYRKLVDERVRYWMLTGVSEAIFVLDNDLKEWERAIVQTLADQIERKKVRFLSYEEAEPGLSRKMKNASFYEEPDDGGKRRVLFLCKKENIGRKNSNMQHVFCYDRILRFGLECEDLSSILKQEAIYIRQCMESVLKNYLELVEYEQMEMEGEKRRSESYAASYETKKNIPKTILEYMKKSRFNEYFGYVELDETCDTEKIDLVFREFAQFKEQFFPNLDLSKVSLRFRRLGKHRAYGLYYPFLRCICIDIHGIQSFGHEFAHMLDDTQGGLSKKADFYPVLKRYRDLIKKEPDSSFPKGKYNRKYYLEATECFARCMEIYLAVVLNVSCDLIDPDKVTGVAYPIRDEELMREIISYYGELFRIHEKRNAA